MKRVGIFGPAGALRDEEDVAQVSKVVPTSERQEHGRRK
jgi:hypothetical protein